MWPFSKSAQILCRQLKSLDGDPRGIVTSLQLLQSTMEELNDPSGHWNSILGDIAQHLADSGVMAKKRKRIRESSISGKCTWGQQT